MKKHLSKLFIVAAIAISVSASAQCSKTSTFVPNGSDAVTFSDNSVTEKNGISATLIAGKMNGNNSATLMISNKNSVAKTFTYTVKDKEGKVVVSHKLTIAAGTTISHQTSDELCKQLLFQLPEGKKTSDYMIEITEAN